MSTLENPRNKLLWRSALAAAISFALTTSVYAQEETEDPDDQQGQEEATDLGRLQVTGSRLKRDTFSSIAPLQIITSDFSREAGLVDQARILQESSAATGQQIDLTFNGFVLDNGPGAQTLSLRGLGANRTLVLLNGRRIAPGGVEGAPTSPDLSLLPNILVAQSELLLDGASSIYGSDAVAGVANVILRQDFDGLEVRAFSEVPEQTGGMRNTLALAWGKNFDRGFVGFGIEATDQERIALRDREWTADCDRHYEITDTGEIRTQDLFWSTVRGQRWDDCRLGSLASRIILGAPGQTIRSRFGSVYYEPGRANLGIPDFSENTLFGIDIDSDNDGFTDLSFRDHDLNGSDLIQNSDLLSGIETQAIMGYGEYTFEGEMNLTPYFEVLYTRRETSGNGGEPQLFPFVPADNPFNICNPNGVNGIDCGLGADAILTNPNYAAQFAAAFGGTPEQFRDAGVFNAFFGELGAITVQPVVAVRGDRNRTFTEVDQTRVVAGLRGDLPQLKFGLNDWSFDATVAYSKNTGDVERPGIRNDLLQLSLTTSRIDPATGQVVCGNGSDGCVPVNLFAPSLYADSVVGDFATQAERDFLFDLRTFDTEYEQIVGSLYFTGGLFEMPAGAVNAGFGVEYRDDKIASIPDNIASGEDPFFGFFSDGGASGSKYTREFYGEIEFPLLADKFLATQLDVNLSARNTKDQFYGSEWTYAGKVGWRPVNSLLIRGTVGTSYRAPNLRENFLQAQTGFINVFDPCVIPADAIDEINGYNPANDDREPQVLENCRANGVDPLNLTTAGIQTQNVEIAQGGATDLNEETSDSLSIGFAFDQPWTDAFGLSLGATYYEIEVNDTIVSPTGQFIINDCYNSLTGNSTFCSRIARDADGFIDILDAGFINRDEQKIRGVDINVGYDQDFTLFERPVSFTADLTLNHPIEVSETFTNEDGTEDFDNDRGEFGFPSWNGQLGLRADVGDYRLSWTTRYIGDVEQDEAGIDVFDDINGLGDTCLGGTDGLCRDVGFADEYFTHTVSLFYRGDTWELGGGIRNVLDEEPPLVDGTEILSISNTPIGYGYDLNGRTFFVNFALNFANF